MKVLVTGGAGFIGSTVVDEYIERGHSVWVIDNESSGFSGQVNKKARYAKIDVTNKTKLRNFFKGKKFDVVNHHAAQIDVRRSVADPVLDAEINIIGILNVLGLSKETGVRKFIFSSSGGTVYGDCKRPALETDPEVPMSPYGVAKLASEKYIKMMSGLYGLSHVILRYANVFGPRQNPHGEAGVVAIFADRLLRGENIWMYGTGGQTRDFVYVKDVARANALALTRGKNEVLNIGTGAETSVKELAASMRDLLGSTLLPARKPARMGELNRSVLNVKRARQVLGWKPVHSLRDGLIETIEFFAQKMAKGN